MVNKTEMLSNVYRNMSLEVLAGQGSFETEVSEGKVKLSLDFAKVYWNTRLSQERTRMLGKLKPKQVLCDLMCGVGPFAVRAAA